MKLRPVIEMLREKFSVRFNEGLELITIRHFDQATIDRVMVNKELLLEQKTRNTARLVVRDLG